jgi:hypothetical protein
LSRPDDFELSRHEDGCVLHDDLGAAILLLSPVAGEVMALLQADRDGACAQTLTRLLFGGDVQSEDSASVETLLHALQSQGLVERRPS